MIRMYQATTNRGRNLTEASLMDYMGRGLWNQKFEAWQQRECNKGKWNFVEFLSPVK